MHITYNLLKQAIYFGFYITEHTCHTSSSVCISFQFHFLCWVSHQPSSTQRTSMCFFTVKTTHHQQRIINDYTWQQRLQAVNMNNKRNYATCSLLPVLNILTALNTNGVTVKQEWLRISICGNMHKYPNWLFTTDSCTIMKGAPGFNYCLNIYTYAVLKLVLLH